MSEVNSSPEGFAALLAKKTRVYGRFVRFSHSIFALPFALAGFALAAKEYGFRWEALLLVVAAMVAARSTAMGFNRIIDRRLDALNPRTAQRELPHGRLSLPAAWVFTLVSAAVFFASAWALNPLCGWLSPVALAITFFYSLSKRFTWTSQFWLGLSLAVAPVGAWLAVTGSLDWRILPLAAAVTFWVAGFDIFYSCLDLEFDQRHGLHSVPGRWGLKGAIRMAWALHAATAALLVGLYWVFNLGLVYMAGSLIVAAVLAVEDAMVRPSDLSRVLTAFDLNGWVSILFFLSVLAGMASW